MDVKTFKHVVYYIYKCTYVFSKILTCSKICDFSLIALNLETGKRSVMHLVARENLPEPATQGTIFFFFNLSQL